jgi:hypothetical protein
MNLMSQQIEPQRIEDLLAAKEPLKEVDLNDNEVECNI